MILIGLWQTIIFDNWPFQKIAPVTRGIVQIVLNVIMTYFVIYGIFEGFLGKTVLPLWSFDQLVLRGIPVETARDLTGGSITMFVLIGSFTYAFWTIAFQRPWGGQLTKPALGLAEWGWTTTITIITYRLVIYPFYVGVALKSPMAASPTWWTGIDGVSYLYWAIGIWEWTIVYLFMTASTWAGKSWDLVKKQPWRGIVTVLGIFILSYITVKVLLVGMDGVWGAVNPKVGDGPTSLAWRYYHCASIGGFTLFPFLIWNHYFDNWPQKWGAVAGRLIRTVGVILIATVGYFLYYALSESIFGLKPTLSNSVNKPLVWLFWAIIPLLFNDWFMEKVPFFKPAGTTHAVQTPQKGDKSI